MKVIQMRVVAVTLWSDMWAYQSLYFFDREHIKELDTEQFILHL